MMKTLTAGLTSLPAAQKGKLHYPRGKRPAAEFSYYTVKVKGKPSAFKTCVTVICLIHQ